MKQNRLTARMFTHWLRTYWVGLVGLALAVLVLAASRTAMAAPSYQTVPNPTPPPTTAPPATATPGRPSSGRDENSSPAPTATPQAAGPQTGTVAPTGVVTANRLNVRAAPGVNSAVIGVALAGETLQILGRNADSSWWRVCCVSGAETEGWVSAQFVRVDFDLAQAGELIALVDAMSNTTVSQAVAGTTASIATTATVTTTNLTTVTGTTIGPALLSMAIEQVPHYAWQGQQLVLRFVITNIGDSTATEVALRDELPTELVFVEAFAADEGKVVEEVLESGQIAFTITWPEVAAGASVSAIVRIQIDEAAPAGAIIDNLAVVSAVGGEPHTAGVTIGMPPATLPLFQ